MARPAIEDQKQLWARVALQAIAERAQVPQTKCWEAGWRFVQQMLIEEFQAVTNGRVPEENAHLVPLAIQLVMETILQEHSDSLDCVPTVILEHSEVREALKVRPGRLWEVPATVSGDFAQEMFIPALRWKTEPRSIDAPRGGRPAFPPAFLHGKPDLVDLWRQKLRRLRENR